MLVEDEVITAMSIREELLQIGHDVSEPVVSGKDAIKMALSDKPTVILMDINIIGDINGIEAIEMIHAKAHIPVIYMTGYSSNEIKERAMRTGPLAFLEKPINILDIKKLLDHRHRCIN